MTSTDEMRRLALHAADLLDNCDPMANAARASVGTGAAADARTEAAQQIAANATASTTLRLIAACMAVQDPAEVTP